MGKSIKIKDLKCRFFNDLRSRRKNCRQCQAGLLKGPERCNDLFSFFFFFFNFQNIFMLVVEIRDPFYCHRGGFRWPYFVEATRVRPLPSVSSVPTMGISQQLFSPLPWLFILLFLLICFHPLGFPLLSRNTLLLKRLWSEKSWRTWAKTISHPHVFFFSHVGLNLVYAFIIPTSSIYLQTYFIWQMFSLGDLLCNAQLLTAVSTKKKISFT